MRLVLISDTHGFHNEIKIPGGDILIHAGDVTMRGAIREVYEFNKWMGDLPHPHKLCIAGNHDFIFRKSRPLVDSILTNVTYLEDSGIVIDGLLFYGSPWQPSFHNMAFNLSRGEALRKKWARIPESTDVLITHSPPKGILDKSISPVENVGCENLRDRVQQTKPHIHLFGHIHEGYGQLIKGRTRFINASICGYPDYEEFNSPIVIDM